jgi:hypothetical protein
MVHLSAERLTTGPTMIRGTISTHTVWYCTDTYTPKESKYYFVRTFIYRDKKKVDFSFEKYWYSVEDRKWACIKTFQGLTTAFKHVDYWSEIPAFDVE